MDQVRAAVIGYGGMGSKYVKMISQGEIDGMVLAGVCCRNEKGQAELRKKYPDAAVYKSVQDAMAHGDEFDAVVIVTPHTSHVEIGKMAARAGKHILSDKPAGVSTKEVKELLEETKKAGVSYGIIFNIRANPVFKKAKELIGAGALGELQRVVWICNTWYRTPAYHKSAPWRSTWKNECGGLLINQSQHYLDIWQWLFGMPDEVLAVLDYGKYNDFLVDDSVDIQFGTKTGSTEPISARPAKIPASTAWRSGAPGDGWRSRTPAA
jgi:predicted dehydrogenase